MVNLSPQLIVNVSEVVVAVSVLPYLVIENESQLGNINRVVFPLLKGTVVGVFHGRHTETVGD